MQIMIAEKKGKAIEVTTDTDLSRAMESFKRRGRIKLIEGSTKDESTTHTKHGPYRVR